MITPDIKSVPDKKIHMRALGLGLVLLLLTGLCLGVVFLAPAKGSERTIARIYQKGELLETIDLSVVSESYTIPVEAPDGGMNVIEVRPGAIGMKEADCPDGLCVKMGFSTDSLLPIVCLPNGLVIEITKTAPATGADTVPDIITY